MVAKTRDDAEDDYWGEVERLLRLEHRAKKAEAAKAVREFRIHMEPAGQTVYNSDPAEVARTIIGHGLIPSIPAEGLNLLLTFQLTDPNAVLEAPMAAAKSAAGLIDALGNYERLMGGEGFNLQGAEALPGLVLVTLKPVRALGAAERLKAVAEELERAFKGAARVDAKLKAEVGLRKAAGEQWSAATYHKAA